MSFSLTNHQNTNKIITMLNIKNRFKLNVKISKKYTVFGKKIQIIIKTIIYDYFRSYFI